MEGKKSHNSASATSHEPEVNDLLNKEEQIQPCMADDSKNAIAASALHDNATSPYQQYLPILQWPYTSQNAVEQPSSSSRPCLPTQSPPSTSVSQWLQLPSIQLISSSHQVQQGLPPAQLAQSTAPFWLPQFLGYQLTGVNAPAMFQPFPPLGTVDASWQVPGVAGGDTATKDYPQVPNPCFAYPYPGFLGPWYPLAGWSKVQHSPPLSAYTFQEACNQSYLQPPKVPSCSASLGQSFQRGTIKPPEKLSQKHQQLWDAQSAENIQLWSAIDQLQSQIADYRSHVMKLEAEIASLKQTVERSTAHIIDSAVSEQAPKRGRPRRSNASADALHSYDKPQPRAQGRKPAQYMTQRDAKAHIFEKVILNKVENKEKPLNANTSSQQESENNSNIFTNNRGDIGILGRNLMTPSFHDQVYQETPQIHLSGIGLNCSQEVNSNANKNEDPNFEFAVTSQQVKGIHDKSTFPASLGTRIYGSLGWPSAVTTDDCGLNASSQGFYHNGSVIKQDGKVIPGWSFVNQENVSEELEATGVARQENEEEMGDDGSSDGGEIARMKGEGAP